MVASTQNRSMQEIQEALKKELNSFNEGGFFNKTISACEDASNENHSPNFRDNVQTEEVRLPKISKLEQQDDFSALDSYSNVGPKGGEGSKENRADQKFNWEGSDISPINNEMSQFGSPTENNWSMLQPMNIHRGSLQNPYRRNTL